MMQTVEYREIRHFHLFCGLGGGARGFNRAQARVGKMASKSRCIGGIDVGTPEIADFFRLAKVPGTIMDLFSRDQYVAFHGCQPPADWREAGPDDIRRAAGGEFPHVVFLSAPCKGFSGLLSETRSKTDKYQALNNLTVRGVMLMLEAFKDDPPELIVFENVPRIANRGRPLLNQIVSILRDAGYAVAETTHDCGRLGGLAQSRKRFLLVARHIVKVPPFLYEPEMKSLRAVGDILERMPFPGLEAAGPMHRIPSLQWKTWVRLAFVEAGSDWRSLNKLRVVDGHLADYLIVPDNRNGGFLGVQDWNKPSGVIASRSLPNNGNFSIADPRPDWENRYGNLHVGEWDKPSGTVIAGGKGVQGGWLSVADPRFQHSDKFEGQAFGVRKWEEPTGTVTSKNVPGQGPYSVADPRHAGPAKHSNEFRIIRYDEAARAVTGAHGTGQCLADPRRGLKNDSGKYKVTPWAGATGSVIGGDDHGAYAVADPRMSQDTDETRHKNVCRVVGYEDTAGTVSGGHGPSSGGQCVADPRINSKRHGPLGVTAWEESSRTVAGESYPSNGPFSVADPRILNREKGDAYLTGGHYGVVPWDSSCGAVSASAGHDNGRWSVADPRMPEPNEKCVAYIRSLDDTWHRPFTTLELAALQSLFEPEEYFELEGLSDSAWRERIGNAVPSDAAQAMAEVFFTTLLLAWSGETFILSSTPIWVRNIAMGLTVKQGELS